MLVHVCICMECMHAHTIVLCVFRKSEELNLDLSIHASQLF